MKAKSKVTCTPAALAAPAAIATTATLGAIAALAALAAFKRSYKQKFSDKSFYELSFI